MAEEPPINEEEETKFMKQSFEQAIAAKNEGNVDKMNEILKKMDTDLEDKITMKNIKYPNLVAPSMGVRKGEKVLEVCFHFAIVFLRVFQVSWSTFTFQVSFDTPTQFSDSLSTPTFQV